MSKRSPFLLALVCLASLHACEDPARPIPIVSGALFVDSDPQGASIFIDSSDTGLRTPSVLDEVQEGARAVHLEFDSAGFTYTADAAVRIGSGPRADVLLPLTIRCEDAECLGRNAEFHFPGNVRFAINAAGPLFTYDGAYQALVWPASTANSYAARGAATFTALVDGEPVALGVHNVGNTRNYWAGRPAPGLTGTAPYSSSVPAWITPPASSDASLMRGLEIVQQAVVHASRPDVIEVVVTWRNISADSLYRTLDANVPTDGLTFTDAWVGFILDPDVGAFAEAFDDLPSYSADRNLVYAYDSDFTVGSFAGGWSDRPALIGLMMLEAPGSAVRLNAWPRARDFVAGLLDAEGRLLLTAEQRQPVNHPDERIGFAPDAFEDDYMISVAAGPVTLEPGASVSARFAVLLAPPATGTFVPGVLQPAGDPLDDDRALAAIARPLLDAADEVIVAQ